MFNCFYESCEQKFFCFIVHGLHNHIHITWDNLLLWSEQTCNKRFSECLHTWWNWDASRQINGSFKDCCLNVCKWDGLNIFFKWEVRKSLLRTSTIHPWHHRTSLTGLLMWACCSLCSRPPLWKCCIVVNVLLLFYWPLWFSVCKLLDV